MNIFVLDPDPTVAARMHCDKHVVKMIVEYAQLLSTAHRLVDGRPVEFSFVNSPRKIVVNCLVDEAVSVEFIDGKPRAVITGERCYKATHANHPCAIWARENGANYQWLARLWIALMNEYSVRYGKVHATAKYIGSLMQAPSNIDREHNLTPHPQTMPPEFQVPNDPVLAYQNFYLGSKIRFAKWTNTPVPEWFATAIEQKDLNVADFQRTSRMAQGPTARHRRKHQGPEAASTVLPASAGSRHP